MGPDALILVFWMEYYSAIKKNEMMPFAATWVVKTERNWEKNWENWEREILYDIPDVCDPKRNDINEFNYKRETDSQTLENELTVAGRKG